MTFYFIFTVLLSGPNFRALEEEKGEEKKRNRGGLEAGGWGEEKAQRERERLKGKDRETETEIEGRLEARGG